jgi:hypothetical protein
MPRNPHKRRCTYPGCRAWALRGADRCQAHRDRPPPPPLGLYADAFAPEDLARLAPFLEHLSLDDEIWMVRMMNERLLQRLREGPVDDELLVRLARLLYQGAGQVARLLRDRRAITGDAEEGFAQAMGRVLDELNTLTDWDVRL